MNMVLKLFLCSSLLLFSLLSSSILEAGAVLLENSQLSVLRDFRSKGWESISVTNDTYCENHVGFTCDNDGYISRIELSNSYVYKPIPESIGNLSNLQYISFNDYYVNSSIPESLGNLKNLYFIQIINNKLSGSIPSSFGNLINLKTLKLDTNSLSGEIPSTFGQLTNLQTLFISGNELSGNIPSSLGSLQNLKDISLSKNQLTGNIPESLGNLPNLNSLKLTDNALEGSITSSLGNISTLTKLDLSNNQLTGGIPLSFSNLTGLQSLSLSGNNLDGTIEINFYAFKNLQSLDLSNNKFKEKLPSNFSSNYLTYYDVSDNYFTGDVKISVGNAIICATNLTNSDLQQNCLSFSSPCTKQQQRSSSACGNSVKTWLIILITFCSLFVFIILLLLAFWVASIMGVLPNLPSIFVIEWLKNSKKKFKFKEIKIATDYFSANNIIIQNNMSTVYISKFKNNINNDNNDNDNNNNDNNDTNDRIYFIRRTNRSFLSKSSVFLNQVNAILCINHSNLLNAVGYSKDSKEQIIVFEHAQNSTLSSCLRLQNGSAKPPLTFVQRLQIASGLGDAILYLHSFLSPPMLHAHISSDNIFLDSNFQTKLGEYGQCIPGSPSFLSFSKKNDKNEYEGYTDPRDRDAHPSFASDVYSFGIVLLELVTGKKPIITKLHDIYDNNNNNDNYNDNDNVYIRLSDWAFTNYHDHGIQSIMDPTLKGQYDATTAVEIVKLAFNCLTPQHERPNISGATAQLGEILNPSNLGVVRTLPSSTANPSLSRELLLDPSLSFDSSDLPPMSKLYGAR